MLSRERDNGSACARESNSKSDGSSCRECGKKKLLRKIWDSLKFVKG